MKATIVVTAEDGTEWSGEVELNEGGAAKPIRRKKAAKPAPPAGATKATPEPSASDLKLPARAFFNRFATKTTAAGKFALVVAQITQGSTGKDVDAGEIERVWNQNHGVLGGPYQSMYGTRAKEKGWVNSTKRGVFFLMDGWQKAANG
jgi:hypothetical protein